MVSGQSRRLDGIIRVKQHLRAANFELYLVSPRPLPPRLVLLPPPHMFSLLCEDSATNGAARAIKVVKLANRSGVLAK